MPMPSYVDVKLASCCDTPESMAMPSCVDVKLALREAVASAVPPVDTESAIARSDMENRPNMS